MATPPLNFNKVTDWVDVTDPLNIPPGARKIATVDLLRYENGVGDLVTRSNLHSAAMDATTIRVSGFILSKAVGIVTENQPSAATAGAGAWFFNVDYGVPVISNGLEWVTFTGEVV